MSALLSSGCSCCCIVTDDSAVLHAVSYTFLYTEQEVVPDSVGANMTRDNSTIDDATAVDGSVDGSVNVSVDAPLDAGVAGTTSEPDVDAVSNANKVRTVCHCTPCNAIPTSTDAALQR
jgi:hypothetical protein